MDHTPENCDLANLLAMCQACHLAYDTAHHQQTRTDVTRIERARGMTELFPDDTP